MSPEKHKKVMARLANEYPAVVKSIDNLVDQIADRVTQFHPPALLQRSYLAHALSALKEQSKTKEELGLNEASPLLVLDYTQSIIAARPPTDTRIPSDEEYFELQSLIGNLYATINLNYHIHKSAHSQLNDPSYDTQQDSFYVRAQMLWMNVSVDRYLIHNIPHIRDFITPHSDILKELFGISSDDLIEALSSIQKSLTEELFTAYFDIREIQKKTLSVLKPSSVGSKEEFQKQLGKAIDEMGLREKLIEAQHKLTQYDLFDLQKTTKLPTKLLDALSWGPGEEQSFFAPGEYRGWPLRLLPVRTRPFLKFDGRYYCFNNNNLQDHIYRTLQMLVTSIKPEYRPKWNSHQREVSEQLPLEMFGRLLPGAKCHSSIQYQWTNKSTNKLEWAEADGLVVFDEVLLVVEVKGGIFTPVSPTTDLQAYVASIRNLVCTPATQARRFINELESRGEVEIFDQKRQSIGRIRKTDFWRIWGICVTVDNISDVGTRHADFKNVGLTFAENPTWIVSLDDLRVFCDLFDSAAVFIHYLEQRLRAFHNPLAHPDDELDFIGMFFAHNNIDLHAKKFGNLDHIAWHGYRQVVDKYYDELISGGAPQKPSQGFYDFFSTALLKLEKSGRPGSTRSCSWLLELADESRRQFDALVRHCIELQSAERTIKPASMLSDDSSILIFCVTPDFTPPSRSWMREYALALVHSMQGKDLLVFELGFKDGDIAWAHGDILGQRHLKEIAPDRLAQLSEKYSQSRLNTLRSTRKAGKIGRNEKCPCGSGRKYKACHGQKKT
ncbi:SEC-C metal-binding domain-containing protein [Archangium violaceum]|uniref:SEC-C metal-binding domain-containing protein n=1 Tax=Archangium violaceum TaxID=83451 RepID=UPI001EEFADF8|nr:SEC-C metal-binding domain-containing protein [Archangium violaceum]